MTSPASPERQASSILRPLALSTLVVGVLDILDAIIFFGLRVGSTPAKIFRRIATSVFGPESMNMGALSASVGVLLHFGVAAGLSAVYWLMTRSMPRVRAHWFISGAVYGIVSYFAMNYAIVPMTRIGWHGFQLPPWPVLLNGLVLAHVFCVGVPIAYVVFRHTRND